MKKVTLITMVVIGLAGAASAGVIFDASTANTSIVNNNGTPGGLAGTPGALTYTGAVNNFNNSGFASTDTINTLNGTALTAADTVTISLSVSSITGGPIRANGVGFGMSGDNSTFLGGTDSMLVSMEAANNGGDILVAASSFQDNGDTGLQVFDNALLLGFDATLTADVNGYTFELYGVHTTSPQVITGTFSGTEFVDNFGNGHFYYSVQKYNNANALVTNITEASITVVPEPATLGLVATFGGGIMFLRRRFKK